MFSLYRAILIGMCVSFFSSQSIAINENKPSEHKHVPPMKSDLEQKEDTETLLSLGSVKDAAKSVVGKVTNLLSSDSKKYLDRLIELNNIEKSLSEINKLHGGIKEEDKTIKAMSEKLRTETNKKVKEAEEKLIKLVDDIKIASNARITDLKARIARKEGQLPALEAAVTAESTVLNYAEKANNFFGGALGIGALINYGKSWNEASQKQAEDAITAIKTKINEIDNQIKNEEQAVRNILTSDAYKASAVTINREREEALKLLVDITSIVQETKIKKIFEPFNPQADAIIKKINDHIKNASCSSLKSMADAKQITIDLCKTENLEKIKKATDIGVCKSLQLNSSIADIEKCKATG